MLLVIDTTSAMPVYAQIIDQIKRAIATGVLKPGDSLPSLRETAVRLRVNMRTVSAAYKQLEIERIVETRHGTGSFVASDVKAVSEEYGRESLTHSIDAVLMDAYRMGVSFDELRKLIGERISNAQLTYAVEPDTPSPLHGKSEIRNPKSEIVEKPTEGGNPNES